MGCLKIDFTKPYSEDNEPLIKSLNKNLSLNKTTLKTQRTYYFGFGGHEKDDEILGEGNHLSFADFGYDPRIGRRWNIDPLTSKYPMISPYATFNNNPVLYDDPSGMSGEASINKQTKTITVTSIYAFYGSASSPKLAKEYAANIEKSFNAANAKIRINGVDYKVQFKVVGVDVSKIGGDLNEKVVEKHISQNNDIKINYVRVEDYNPEQVYGVSATDGHGANTGFWSTNQVAETKGTVLPHEHNHSLNGLKHPEEVNPSGGNNSEDPSIDMTPNSTNFVKPKYFGPNELGNVFLDESTRKVTQKNVDAIFTKEVKDNLVKNGKTDVGKITNKYHSGK
jgi:hypothetical protein